MKRMLTYLFCLLGLIGSVWAQETRPAASQLPTTTSVSPRAVVVDIKGEINDYSAMQLKKRIDRAKLAGVEMLIIHIDTPGGAVGAAMEMSRLLKREGQHLHTIAYVDPIAYSAGSMISLACTEIVMAPGAMLGDCAPILMGQSGGLEQITGAERAKMESPIVTDFEESASRNGYDQLLARSFVQFQVTVHYMQSPAGEKRFVMPKEYERLLAEDWKPVAGVKDPVDDESTLLTVNDTTAVALGLSKGTFSSVEAFAQSRGINIVDRYETTTGEALVGFLNSASVRGLLSVVFMFSIYTAFNKPGSGFAEAAVAISGALLLGVPLLTGYASWLEIMLIMLGIALLAIELFIIPGFGVAGVSGILLILAGLVMTFVPSEAPALPNGPSIVPQLPQTRDGIKEGLLIVSVGMLLSMALWLWLSRYLHRIPYMNRLVLNTVVGSTLELGSDPVRELVDSAWPAVGAEGVVVTELRPGGTARFEDAIINDQRNVDVISDHGYVSVGARVVVKRKDGTEILVREVS